MRKRIQLVIPVFNEQDNIFSLYEEVMNAVVNLNYDFYLLFINDGSRDHTLLNIQALAGKYHNVSFVDLSRNYGKEIALTAGLDYATGDAVIFLDGDLQHPPQMIPIFIKEWEQGYLDVFGVRANRDEEPLLVRSLKNLFYKLLNKYSKVEQINGAGDFRLLDRKVVEALKQYREKKRYNKGLYNIVGFKKKAVTYDVNHRRSGNSKWNFLQLMNLAIDGITSFSTAPLRISTLLGTSIAIVSFAYLVFSILKTLIWGEPVQGYPTLISIIILLGGIQLISLGIIGEYISVIFQETKNRPLYSVNEYKPSEENEK